MNPSDGPDRHDDERGLEVDDLERASENVLGGWPSAQLEDPPADPVGAPALEEEDGDVVADAQPVTSPEPGPEPEDAAEPAPEEPEDAVAPTAETTGEHAPGDLAVPPGYPVLEGEAHGARRAVGVVVSRFNGEVTGGLLQSALEELEACGVERESVTVMPVPGAFELPLAAMALAKTRRYACIVALGCVIRGDTPHFDLITHEAASGLQLAAIETGVPVAFGVLTVENAEQAEERIDRAAEAVRSALEMADVFSQLRAQAAGPLH
jgi:6,7-dimethyl-8-ribityllumazine synthase